MFDCVLQMLSSSGACGLVTAQYLHLQGPLVGRLEVVDVRELRVQEPQHSTIIY